MLKISQQLNRLENLSSKNRFMSREILLAAICLLVTLVEVKFRIVDVTLSMATARLDDNPIVASLVMNSSNFQSDAYARMISDTGGQSLFYLIPILILKTQYVATSTIWLAMIIIQRFVLLYAISRFSGVITKSFWTRVLIILFISAGQPYYWNLAWLGDGDLTPYAFWSSLGFGIWAYSELVRRNIKSFYLLFALAFLMHVTFGIQLGLLFSLVIIKNRKNIFKVFLVEFGALFLAFFIQGLRLREIQMAMPDKIWDIVKGNGHLQFYNYFESQYAQGTLKNYILLGSIIFIVTSSLKKIENNKLDNAIFELYIGGALLMFHHIGILADFKPVISFFGPRFTVLVALLFAIRCVVIFVDWINDSKIYRRILGITCLLLPAVSILFATAMITAISLKKESRPLNLFKSVTLGLYVFLANIPVLAYLLNLLHIQNRFFDYTSYIYASHFNPLQLGFVSYLVPAVLTNRAYACLILLLIITVIGSRRNRKSRLSDKSNQRINSIGRFKKDQIRLSIFVLFAVGLPIGFTFQYPYSYGVPLEKVSETAKLQKWVFDNTDEDSMFSIRSTDFLSWRTLTERPAAALSGIYPSYLYLTYIDELNLALTRYWDDPRSVDSNHPKGTWDEKFYCSYDYQQVEYIVSDTAQVFKFPIVYQSKNYRIYSVKCPN